MELNTIKYASMKLRLDLTIKNIFDLNNDCERYKAKIKELHERQEKLVKEKIKERNFDANEEMETILKKLNEYELTVNFLKKKIDDYIDQALIDEELKGLFIFPVNLC